MVAVVLVAPATVAALAAFVVALAVITTTFLAVYVGLIFDCCVCRRLASSSPPSPLDCAGEVAVLLALGVVVGFCDREYSTELVFELVDGLWSDHAVDACQFVSEGDQRVVHRTAFGRCHDGVLILFMVGENY